MRPNAGLGPFLAGAYRWKEGSSVPFGNTLLRSVLTPVASSFRSQKVPRPLCFPDRFSALYKYVIFCDAAPRRREDRFSTGVFMPVGEVRTWKCYNWVSTLHPELSPLHPCPPPPPPPRARDPPPPTEGRWSLGGGDCR